MNGRSSASASSIRAASLGLTVHSTPCWQRGGGAAAVMLMECALDGIAFVSTLFHLIRQPEYPDGAIRRTPG